jgi:hypothetical protein
MSMKYALAIAALLIAASPALAQDKKSKGTRFWNLTGTTIAKFELAPAGTTTFGPDQCKNDKDGEVDNDERLKIVGVADGKYDARLTDSKGRVCMALGLEVKTDGVFSVEADQLKDCKPAS